MGYRFTLESANTVANLTFGKVMSCYRDIYSSPECYEGFMHFLDQFQDNLYSNEIGRYMRSVQRIRKTLHRYEDYRWPLDKVEYDDTYLHFHKDALDALKVDGLGLDEVDLRYLRGIIERFKGGPVGLETLAATIGEEATTIEDVYEPYLLQLGFLNRTPRGRMVTKLAYEHFGIDYLKDDQISF